MEHSSAGVDGAAAAAVRRCVLHRLIVGRRLSQHLQLGLSLLLGRHGGEELCTVMHRADGQSKGANAAEARS